ncbi:hypothetical protein [Brachyspira hampsonii]|uniref:hypothetical protein n=1 Tax=Brachyspira hampsonii TaxID=1287055 RepID=UPI000D3CE200|nr:hypothetical protein [Brachyspira hampsonii]PTY40125.1 hypothetical protein DQ06_05880 [Brachyspira hampsonii bv. II]
MSYMHKDSVNGKWKTLSLAEQMANIGSEVYRAIKFKKKNNSEYSKNAAYRALELIDLTILAQYKKHSIKEFTRLREVLCDYLLGDNEYNTDESIMKYFDSFAYILAKRKGR